MPSEQNNKEAIRPIYSFFQGCLSQTPNKDERNRTTYSSDIWDMVNSKIEDLNKVTQRDFNLFKLKPKISSSTSHSEYLEIETIRVKLGGMISELHGRYFSDEPAPFSGMPSTIINQTQQQNQSVTVQMLLDVQSKIDQNLSKFEEGTKQKKFLQKVRSSLSSIKDAVGLISLLTNIAKEFGLSIDDLKNIFGS